MKTYKEFREAISPRSTRHNCNLKKKEKNPKNEAQGSCWDGYEQKGMKKKGDRMVPNCVPVGEENIEEKNVPTNRFIYGQEQVTCKVQV